MSKNKASKIQANYKKRAKLLKKHHLINYDLRKTLSPQQKAAITRLWVGKPDSDDSGHHSGWGSYLENDNIVYRNVGDKRKRQLKALGYKTHKNRVYIDSEGFPELHIKDNKIIKRKGDKELIDLLVAKHDIFETLERLVNTPLPRGEFVTVRIGDNGMFRREVLTSYEALLNYLSRWSPKKDFNKKDELIEQMSIVRFNRDSLNELPKKRRASKREKIKGRR